MQSSPPSPLCPTRDNLLNQNQAAIASQSFCFCHVLLTSLHINQKYHEITLMYLMSTPRLLPVCSEGSRIKVLKCFKKQNVFTLEKVQQKEAQWHSIPVSEGPSSWECSRLQRSPKGSLVLIQFLSSSVPSLCNDGPRSFYLILCVKFCTYLFSASKRLYLYIYLLSIFLQTVMILFSLVGRDTSKFNVPLLF